MSKKKRALRTPDDFIANVLSDETDRGCVLVAAGFIDYQLEQLLREHFSGIMSNRPSNSKQIENVLIDGSQPLLGSFWAKNTMAHLLGLIDDEFHDLIDEIRELRNTFAHKPGKVTLDCATVDPIVAKLHSESNTKLMEIFQANYDSGSEASPWHFVKPKDAFSATRITFMHLCLVIHFYLAGKLKTVELNMADFEGSILTKIHDSKSKSADDGPPRE
jgi:hypothetical protein